MKLALNRSGKFLDFSEICIQIFGAGRVYMEGILLQCKTYPGVLRVDEFYAERVCRTTIAFSDNRLFFYNVNLGGYMPPSTRQNSLILNIYNAF